MRPSPSSLHPPLVPVHRFRKRLLLTHRRNIANLVAGIEPRIGESGVAAALTARRDEAERAD